MKIPKAKQLPSGSWFCRVRVDGKDIGITRPTEKEAVAEAMAVKAGIKERANIEGKDKTVLQAIDDYIEARSGVLSPATVRGYEIIKKHRFQKIMGRKIGSISPEQWQSAVSELAKKYSAKTVKNSWGLLSSVITVSTGKSISVKLPQVIPNAREFLDADQIPIFLNAVKGRKVEIAALLALSSLRRSEIMALDWNDVDLQKGIIKVAAATVQDANNKMVRKKETKNQTSHRTVPMIQPLRDALEAVEDKSGPVAKMSLTRMYVHINQVCRESGLPEVGVHGLRHSFASLAYHLEMPEKITMEIGGWSDLGTMRNIYTHIAQRDREKYSSSFLEFFEDNSGT